MCSVDLIEPPEQILGGSVDVISTRIIGEIVAQGRSSKLLPEQINLVQEQNDTCPHEPPGIDD